jgi:hypothetical protein
MLSLLKSKTSSDRSRRIETLFSQRTSDVLDYDKDTVGDTQRKQIETDGVEEGSREAEASKKHQQITTTHFEAATMSGMKVGQLEGQSCFRIPTRSRFIFRISKCSDCITRSSEESCREYGKKKEGSSRMTVALDLQANSLQSMYFHLTAMILETRYDRIPSL